MVGRRNPTTPQDHSIRTLLRFRNRTPRRMDLPMSTLYNLHHDGDQYRITKFTDGNVESSYLCTETECECPAGVRPTCRHRQMLPSMLAAGITNTHWFWDYDRMLVMDLNGFLFSDMHGVAEGPT